MPVESKSRVILIELKNLPNQQSMNWGNMGNELEPVPELTGRPILAKPIDVQPHFPIWMVVKQYNNSINILPVVVMRHHPYKPNELWSLQNAVKYAYKLHLDKTYRLNHCSILSYPDQRKMVKYAVHDVLAVTFLLRPIMENWTFKMIETRNMKEVFVAFESIELAQLQTTIKKKKKKNIDVEKLTGIFAVGDSDIEPISSDEEVYLHQIIQQDDKMELESATTAALGIDDELIGDVEETIDIVQLVPDPTEQQPPQRRKKIRSTEAQKKHNKKRKEAIIFGYSGINMF
ncbi:unnamed protein product [Adineta ricciae]|uniref:Uncharacterized protein n=1 Tax=Adineta ricciae TaxID=249248 RepID=A0A815VDK0_ADIRI|nr:unnamed protein product [Adineta ricciae]CAF1538314.1 unnamed protein product [Adineta ricciae]